MKYYIAGKMRGRTFYNFPAFDEARDMLEKEGHDVISPADLDRETGFDPYKLPLDHDWNKEPEGFDVASCADRDIQGIKDADAIFMLEGWEESTLAPIELGIAKWYGKMVRFQKTTKEKVEGLTGSELPSGETRIKNEKTGGEKGQKIYRYELIPTDELRQVAKLYGKGAEKYDDDNWRKGYNWSLSFGAMMRHAWLFWEGEYMDEETDCPHLAAVVFHALALMYFNTHHKELDNRPK